VRAFATPRRTQIVENADGIDDEDLIARADMVVTVTMTGYIKRVPLETYRAQRRGGKGRSAMNTKADDVITELFVASTHAPVLFFSTLGRVYRLKVYKLPEGLPGARGRSMANLLPLAEGETISTVLPLPEDETTWGALHVMFATKRGLVRRNSMDAFTNVPTAGKIAMRFEEGSEDKLIGVALCDETDDALLATRAGKAIRFAVTDVREFQSRTATGVRGISLAADDAVISLTILGGVATTAEEREAYLAGSETLAPERRSALQSAEQFLLTVTAGGFGKRTSAYAYRRSGRGGQGIATLNVTPKTGPVLATFPVADGEHLMLVTNQGKLIRTEVSEIRIAGRATQGVKLLDVADGEQVVSAARIPEDDE
jgi:DNA gyrase subunit A